MVQIAGAFAIELTVANHRRNKYTWLHISKSGRREGDREVRAKLDHVKSNREAGG